MTKKLYTEEQYDEYSKLMKRIEKEKDVTKRMELHIYTMNWIHFYDLSNIAVNQMKIRMSKLT